MSATADSDRNPDRTTPMDCLTTARRRRAVRVLSDRESSMTERQLATQLVATAAESPITDVPDDAVESTRLGLRHVDLPKLADAGLATWDESDAIVTPTSHPILEDDRFQELLAFDDDAVVGAVTDDRCRHVIAAVTESADGLTREELADALAARTTDGEPSPPTIERVRITLRHVLVPKLEDAGLLETDADGTVTYCGPPSLPGMPPVGDDYTSPTDDDSGVEIKIP